MPSFLFFTVITYSLFLTSCSVSSLLNLKEAAPVFSNEIILPDLPVDFVIKKDTSFPSWKNTKTANMISVLSDCSNSDMNLKNAHAVITNAIDNEIVIEEKKVEFKNTSGFYRKVTGRIDGHYIEIQSTSFKFKKCFYVTSLSGLLEKTASDLQLWQTFNQNIEFKK